MSHLEISLWKYLYLRKRLAKSATMFHLGMRPALYLYTRKRNVRWQCSVSKPKEPLLMIRIGRPLYSKPDPSRPLFMYLEINLLTFLNNNIMNRFFKFLAVTVDVLLIIDIASDLCRKWKEKKAQTPTTVSETEEEPEPVTE